MESTWSGPSTSTTEDSVDTTITDVVYMDLGLCGGGVRQDRTLGDTALCTSTEALGRVIIGAQLWQQGLGRNTSSYCMISMLRQKARTACPA